MNNTVNAILKNLGCPLADWVYLSAWNREPLSQPYCLYGFSCTLDTHIKWIFRFLILFFPLLLSLPVQGQSLSQGTTKAEDGEGALYWHEHREGWFWYQDPRPPTPDKEKESSITKPPPKLTELLDFTRMQETLENLKRIAVMNPTDSNLLAYMRFQRAVMDRSEQFADRWQKLVWRNPDLDYALQGRPTNEMAMTVFDQNNTVKQEQSVRALAKNHALLFIFRSDCPYCHRFGPILKAFEQQYGITVFPVSLDGKGIPDYPRPQTDNGIAARLNATVVPALYLTNPTTREIKPVGFGVMALSELLERVSHLAVEEPSRTPLPYDQPQALIDSPTLPTLPTLSTLQTINRSSP